MKKSTACNPKNLGRQRFRLRFRHPLENLAGHRADRSETANLKQVYSGIWRKLRKDSASWLDVDEDSAGQRLDNFLMRHAKGVPKSHIYRIVRSGEVRVNKGRVSADYRVQAGDQVRLPPIRIAEKAVDAPLAPAREFVIAYEDEAILVVDKPAGTAVHGGSGVSFGVIEQLRRA